jgi:hypothetical protein
LGSEYLKNDKQKEAQALSFITTVIKGNQFDVNDVDILVVKKDKLKIDTEALKNKVNDPVNKLKAKEKANEEAAKNATDPLVKALNEQLTRASEKQGASLQDKAELRFCVLSNYIYSVENGSSNIKQKDITKEELHKAIALTRLSNDEINYISSKSKNESPDTRKRWERVLKDIEEYTKIRAKERFDQISQLKKPTSQATIRSASTDRKKQLAGQFGSFYSSSKSSLSLSISEEEKSEAPSIVIADQDSVDSSDSSPRKPLSRSTKKINLLLPVTATSPQKTEGKFTKEELKSFIEKNNITFNKESGLTQESFINNLFKFIKNSNLTDLSILKRLSEMVKFVDLAAKLNLNEEAKASLQEAFKKQFPENDSENIKAGELMQRYLIATGPQELKTYRKKAPRSVSREASSEEDDSPTNLTSRSSDDEEKTTLSPKKLETSNTATHQQRLLTRSHGTRKLSDSISQLTSSLPVIGTSKGNATKLPTSESSPNLIAQEKTELSISPRATYNILEMILNSREEMGKLSRKRGGLLQYTPEQESQQPLGGTPRQESQPPLDILYLNSLRFQTDDQSAEVSDTSSSSGSDKWRSKAKLSSSPTQLKRK